jgi:hypothetical protein
MEVGAVPIVTPGRKILDGKLAFDHDKQQLVYTPPSGARVELAFGGSRYLASDSGPAARTAGIQLLVDVEKQGYEVLLPRSASSLRAPERPSRLLAWYLEEVRNASNLRPPPVAAPSGEDPA